MSAFSRMFLHHAARAARATAGGVAQRQMQLGHRRAARAGGAVAKRMGGESGCTPCQVMARADAASQLVRDIKMKK